MGLNTAFPLLFSAFLHQWCVLNQVPIGILCLWCESYLNNGDLVVQHGAKHVLWRGFPIAQGFLRRTFWPQAQFSVSPRFFKEFLMLLRFISSSSLLIVWTVQKKCLIVDQTHLVLASGKASSAKNTRFKNTEWSKKDRTYGSRSRTESNLALKIFGIVVARKQELASKNNSSLEFKPMATFW